MNDWEWVDATLWRFVPYVPIPYKRNKNYGFGR